MTRRILILPTALALVALTACGGSQRGGGSDEWNTVYDVVPAEATAAFLTDWNAHDRAEFLAALDDMADSPAGMGVNVAFGFLAEQLGLEGSGVELIEELGIDLEGDMALFTTHVMPIAMVRMTDPEALDRHLDAFLDRNPDVVATAIEVGDYEFRSMQIDDLLHLDAGQVGDYAVVRLRAGSAEVDVSDEQLAAILDGTPAGARFVDRPAVVSMMNRAGDNEISMAVWIDSAGLSHIVSAAMGLAEVDGRIEDLDAMGLSLTNVFYESDEQRARCEEAAERFATTMPGFGGIYFRDPENPLHYRGASVLRFSAAGAEDMRSYLPGTVSSARANLDGAAVYAAAHFDFQAMYDGANGDADNRTCPNLAAIPGLFAHLKETESRWLEYNINFAEGAGALALYDVDFAGFLPNPTLAVMVGANDTVGMMEEIQELLEDAGATGTVQTDAAITTIEYRQLIYRMLLMMTDGRIVFSMGGAPQSILNTLASGEEGDNWLEFSLEGEGFTRILENALEYISNTGMLDEMTLATVESVVESYSRIITYDIEGYFDGNDVIMDLDIVMSPRED